MPTVSYIKVYGPPVHEAIKALEKIAIDFPEVCINNTIISGTPDLITQYYTQGESNIAFSYFKEVNNQVTAERCDKLISKSGVKLGDYDFYFEWFQKPTADQVNDLIKKIDKEFKKLGVTYTITTKDV